jgi:hypothetical protein
VLDDLPSWTHGNSERDEKARDGGTSRLNRGMTGQKPTSNNGQGLVCRSARETEGS